MKQTTKQHEPFDDYFEQCALLLNLTRNPNENDDSFKERIKQKYLDPQGIHKEIKNNKP